VGAEGRDDDFAGATSTASLFLLFADQVVPKDKAMTRGFQVPGTDVKVQLVALARLLAAATLWSMRERGLVSVDLVHEERKGLFGKKKTSTVVRVERSGKEGRGIDGLVTRMVPDEGTTAWRVTASLVGQKSQQPGAQLLSRLIVLAGEEGVVEAEVNKWTSTKAHPPSTERVAELEPVFAEVRDAWQRFQEGEPELAAALLAECKTGIDTMTSSTSSV
jgi:hypothetical protein